MKFPPLPPKQNSKQAECHVVKLEVKILFHSFEVGYPVGRVLFVEEAILTIEYSRHPYQIVIDSKFLGLFLHKHCNTMIVDLIIKMTK